MTETETATKTGYIFRDKRGRYLDNRFRWQEIPYAFPFWHVRGIFEEVMNYQDKPVQIGEVADHTSFDLDKVKWEDLPK